MQKYTYIDTIAYDLFGQRSYIRYGNGAETRYSYSSNRQRLSNLTVNANNVKVMDNTYRYDVMDNITSLVNAGKPQTLQSGKTIGGSITHTYQYDEWDRLVGAKGTFNGGSSKSATYDLRMEYDKLYNITSKQLNLTQNNLQFAGSLKTGYQFKYNYKEDDPFKLESIDTKQYSTEGDGEADTIYRVNSYDFDDNGNQTLLIQNTQTDSACLKDTMGTKVKSHLWDEENRLLAINDNGFVSNYFYDAAGERTVKISKPDLFVYVNSSEKLKGDSLPVKFVGYVSPYLVVTNGGRYTKHIYAGTQRIASKLGDIDAFGADPRRVVTAGHDADNAEPIDFGTKYKNQNDAFKARFDSLGSKFNGKTLDDYVNGKSFCCGDKNLDEIEKNSAQTVENAKLEDNLYFYHPDHLGSTSMVTNYDGEVTQNVAYIPYGEVFVEERNGSWASPFLFNAKELDEETGLYYYGARYLNPTDCRWLSVDPKFEKYVGMSPYNYCAGNPVKLVDPDGKDVLNDYEEDYNRLKGKKEDKQKYLEEIYGSDFENKEKNSFSSESEYKTYKERMESYKKIEKKFTKVKKNYDIVNKYIENYKKVDPEGFEIANKLTYEINGEIKKFDIHISLDNRLSDFGGAKTDLKMNRNTGEYLGYTYLSPYFIESDHRMAHELGHNVTNASDPIYWSNHHISDLNCQENQENPQAKTAIEWQKNWDVKYNNLKK